MMWVLSLIRRARHHWTENDGKPLEERAAGRDLKEMVLTVALVMCTALGALVVFMQVAG